MEPYCARHCLHVSINMLYYGLEMDYGMGRIVRHRRTLVVRLQMEKNGFDPGSFRSCPAVRRTCGQAGRKEVPDAGERCEEGWGQWSAFSPASGWL